MHSLINVTDKIKEHLWSGCTVTDITVMCSLGMLISLQNHKECLELTYWLHHTGRYDNTSLMFNGVRFIAADRNPKKEVYSVILNGVPSSLGTVLFRYEFNLP